MKYGFVFVAKHMNDSSRERTKAALIIGPYIFGFVWVEAICKIDVSMGKNIYSFSHYDKIKQRKKNI